MSIILNELKHVNHIIEKGEVGNKPTSTLFLLGKYYRQKENLNKSQTFQQLNNFMIKYYKNYNPALWEDIIEDISKKAHKYPLREINYISITQVELTTISDMQNIKYEKLLFTMLCYAKLYNLLSDKNKGWVNTSIQEIYRTARVAVKYKKDKFLYLNDIERTGLISFSNKNDNLNLRVNFVDNCGSPTMRISDFRELGYEYMNYINKGKFIRCIECKKLIKKTNNKCKYCIECSKKRKLIQNKSYREENRKLSEPL